METPATTRGRSVSLDVVVPVWNEEDALGLLFERLRNVFLPDALAPHGISQVRYIFVDDGSRDRSAALIAAEIAAGFPGRLIRFSRNFGHQNALCAGMDASTGDLVALIDADLQDPPELILDMVDRWRQGYEVVYGERRKRKESLFKVGAYWLFYRLVALLADIQIPLDSGDFCLMDRRVVQAIVKLPERLRFPRGLRAWVGFRQTGLAYDRPARQAGVTKYSIVKLYKLATDGVISSSVRPLQLAQFFSVCYLALTLGLGALFLLRPTELGLAPPVLGGYLLILSGNFVQIFCIYILGAYVGRTYLEVKGRPSYLVMEVVESEARPHEPPG